jgi:hypothetical protein
LAIFAVRGKDASSAWTEYALDAVGVVLAGRAAGRRFLHADSFLGLVIGKDTGLATGSACAAVAIGLTLARVVVIVVTNRLWSAMDSPSDDEEGNSEQFHGCITERPQETVETGSNLVFVRIMKNSPKGQECGKRCDRIGLPPLLFPYTFEVCTTSRRSRSTCG